ncbi:MULTISPECIES: hypothetical protein [Protofrankia]|uniref:Uncharacterized protein n=2 Tax=Candidatus Protofrankia datiscae TaxID=2716812 RepID=F8AW53_9ACTN|nr:MULTISPECIES: hypothetical protein [Protofrankia]AEH11378.1 hypothetical protein FsymDg_4107 [Candidatus Protofrankia datiscae]
MRAQEAPGGPGEPDGLVGRFQQEGGALMWDGERSDDDRDIGWGDDQDWLEEEPDVDLERLRAERPPHHIERDVR